MPVALSQPHMAAYRAILHCDCNGFFASVECLDHPAYWQVPIAVAGDPKDRSGIILAKNEPAKKYGIVTAETIYAAKRKCPSLLLVPPRHWRYEEISAQVNRIYLQYTDQVEPFGIDESFLDVTGSLPYFHTTARALADQIRERVKREVGITISVGASFNKTFAKIGSDMKKPDATTEITPENFQTLVWALPIRDMLFVGKASVEAFERSFISTIGDLARKPREQIAHLLGKSGEALWDNANGLDCDPVLPYGECEQVKSVGNGMTFRRDLLSETEIRQGGHCPVRRGGHAAARGRAQGAHPSGEHQGSDHENDHAAGNACHAYASAKGACGCRHGHHPRQMAHHARWAMRAHPRTHDHRAKSGARRRGRRADQLIRPDRRGKALRAARAARKA